MKNFDAELYEMLLSIVRSLIDDPRDVKITINTSGDKPIFCICVPPKDLGKVIGKQGRTARSIRIVASACAHKHGESVIIDIQANPDSN